MRFLLPLILIAGFLLQPSGALAGPASEFQKGWKDFHYLLKKPSKAKYRSYWMQAKKHFLNAYNQSPSGSYAPKSLYYMGRVYEELGKRSWVTQDLVTAVDYYGRCVARFPNHSWSDDAQFRKATVYRDYLKDTNQAYIEFLRVVHNYPKGDMYPKAQKVLREMDQANVAKNGSSKPKPARKTRKPVASSSGMANLEQIRHWSSDDYTRVVLDLDDNVSYKYDLLKPDTSLGTPHRLCIDLQNTRLGETQTEYTISDGILKQVRSGQFRNDEARVVLDIEGLDNYRIFSLENPFRIVVDVYAPEKKVKAAKAPKRKDLPLGVQAGTFSGSLVEQLGLTVQTIMLDAGHGGKDPGAVNNRIYEKDINLKMVKILGKLLEEKGFNVLYTRTTDVFLPLDERTAMANTKKADLFISIHCNAHPNRNVRGFEIYYLNLAKTKDAVRVAARENAVSVKKISDLQIILTDLMLNSKIKESNKLADDVHTSATKFLKKVYSDFRDHGVREAPFYVLMGAKMPAILIELGYMSNSHNLHRLQNQLYLEHMAHGLVTGITGYKKRIERFASSE